MFSLLSTPGIGFVDENLNGAGLYIVLLAKFLCEISIPFKVSHIMYDPPLKLDILEEFVDKMES